jgi:hypothetical protein
VSLDWTSCITIAVSKANVTYVATGANSGIFGFAEISGDAIFSYFDPQPSREELHVSLTIQGRPAAQVKSEAVVWPRAFDEVTTTDNIIGIVLKPNEFDHRQGYVFLHPAQFERLTSAMNFPSKIEIRLYLRPSAQSGCELIMQIDFNAKIISKNPQCEAVRHEREEDWS